MVRTRSGDVQLKTRRTAAPLASTAAPKSGGAGAPRTRSGAACQPVRRSSRLLARSATSNGLSGSQRKPRRRLTVVRQQSPMAAVTPRSALVHQQSPTAQEQAITLPEPAVTPQPNPMPQLSMQPPMIQSSGPLNAAPSPPVTPRHQSPPARPHRDPRLDGRHQYRCPECGFHARLCYFPPVWVPENQPGSSSEDEEDPVDIEFIRQVDMQIRAAGQAAFVILGNH